MFNLLISNDSKSWDKGSYDFDKNRVAIEYTADEISERYKDLKEEHIEELKGFPTLFVTENEQTPSKIGWITQITNHLSMDLFPRISIEFQFDPNFSELPIGTIKDLKDDIDLGRLEISRTHWAIKDARLFEVLLRRGFISKEQLYASQILRKQLSPDPEPKLPKGGEFNKTQVFIVHGRSDFERIDVAKFVTDLGFEPIILHEQASSGLTIIEKIEKYSNVGFAIVIYTPCDIGYQVGDLTMNHRARQNVVFEHGFFIGRLHRQRVVAIVNGDIETPNDISGVVYVEMDESESWKEKIKTEMRSLGYQIK